MMIPLQNREVLFENVELESSADEKKLTVIHFNDVYNIDERADEPIGGAARFYTALNCLKQENPSHLVLFSGDALSPSTISVFAKGRQVIDAMNEFGIHAAAIGNHEFDMGLEQLETLIDNSKFPWLLSNVFDADTSKPLLKNIQTKLIVEIQGHKVGVFALAEKEWVCSLSCLSFDEVRYEPYVEFSKQISKELREDGAEIVIALTHMRWRNDENLAKKVLDVDLILGGHDHDYEIKKVDEKWIVKSGSDFRELSIIQLDIQDKIEVRLIEKVKIDSKILPNEQIQKMVSVYLENTSKMLDQEIGYINTPLDGRYTVVRTRETNLGNFMSDIVLTGVVADCCLLNAGSLRSDRIHPVGPFTLKDLRDILSFESELVVLSVTGKELHQVLENGLFRYHDIGGRFPQVSEIFFTYDPTKPAGDRVDKRLIKVHNQCLELNKTYSLATNTFMAKVDPVLQKCPVVVSHENIPQLHTLVVNYFKSIEALKNQNVNQNEIENQKNNMIPHCIKYKVRVVNKQTEKKLIDEIGEEIFEKPTDTEKRRARLKSQLSFHSAGLLIAKTERLKRNVMLRKDIKKIKQTEQYKTFVDYCHQKSIELKPRVENRSIMIENEEVLKALVEEMEAKKNSKYSIVSSILPETILNKV